MWFIRLDYWKGPLGQSRHMKWLLIFLFETYRTQMPNDQRDKTDQKETQNDQKDT